MRSPKNWDWRACRLLAALQRFDPGTFKREDERFHRRPPLATVANVEDFLRLFASIHETDREPDPTATQCDAIAEPAASKLKHGIVRQVICFPPDQSYFKADGRLEPMSCPEHCVDARLWSHTCFSSTRKAPRLLRHARDGVAPQIHLALSTATS